MVCNWSKRSGRNTGYSRVRRRRDTTKLLLYAQCPERSGGLCRAGCFDWPDCPASDIDSPNTTQSLRYSNSGVRGLSPGALGKVPQTRGSILGFLYRSGHATPRALWAVWSSSSKLQPRYLIGQSSPYFGLSLGINGTIYLPT